MKNEDTLKYTGQMRLITIFQYLLTAVLLWGAGAFAALAQQPDNALDHMLQKPSVTKRFEQKKFGDHMFVEAEAGLNALGTHSPKAGFEAGVALGDWLTPEHGWRVGFSGRLLRCNNLDSKLFNLSLDYLMNISAVANRKYERAKPFEVYGIAGIDLVRSHCEGIKDLGYGLHMGMRGQWNAKPFFYLYAEPRAGLLSNSATQVYTWHKFRPVASLSVGMGYRLQPSTRIGSVRKDTSDAKRIFVSVMGGYTFLSDAHPSTWRQRDGARAGISLGTWFNPYNGLRLTAQSALFEQNVEHLGRVKALGLQADYMLNLHNLFAGYDSSRRFGLYLLAGGGYHGSWTGSGEGGNFTWSAGGGLQANVHVAERYSLFVEGRADMFGKKYSPRTSSISGFDFMPSLMAGVAYDFRPLPYRKQQTPAAFDHSKWHDHLFVEFGLGGNLPLNRAATDRGVKILRPQAYAAAGKWFTPVHGMRLWGQIAQTQYGHMDGQRTKHVTAGADYLYNFTNAWMGYLPHRHFFLTGAAGVNISKRQKREGIAFGGDVSLRANYRLNNLMSLFIEPKAQIYGRDYLAQTASRLKISGLVSATAGVQFDMNSYSMVADKDYDADELPAYISVAAGASVPANNMHLKTASIKSGRLSFTQFFTPWTAWRLNGEAGLGKTDGCKYAILRAGGDLVTDITAHAYGFDPNRVCSVLAYAGANVGLDYTKGKGHPLADLHIGGQLSFRINGKSAIFVEPQMDYLISKRYNQRSLECFRPQLMLGYKHSIERLRTKKTK